MRLDPLSVVHKPPSTASIIRTYYTLTATYTLSVSFVWGINTLFLMDAGLDIFQVMLVNAAFTAGMVLFEVPTGVVADTVGRKASFLLCLSVILVTTLLYVAAGHYRWGLLPFVEISIFVGLGFTFFTGAVDAWLVDALEAAGYKGSSDRVFAGGQTVFAASMFVGAVAGGVLDQIHLSLPYLARAGMLVPTFLIALFTMKDYGFTPRPLKASRFAAEARKVFVEGITFGWRDPVIRMCVLAAFVQGLFFIYGWYSWQRYFLDLLERELVWVAGIYSALFSLALITGNQLVKRIFPQPEGKRASILAWTSVIRGTTVVAVGLIGILLPAGHRGVGAFTAAAILYLARSLSAFPHLYEAPTSTGASRPPKGPRSFPWIPCFRSRGPWWDRPAWDTSPARRLFRWPGPWVECFCSPATRSTAERVEWTTNTRHRRQAMIHKKTTIQAAPFKLGSSWQCVPGGKTRKVLGRKAPGRIGFSQLVPPSCPS